MYKKITDFEQRISSIAYEIVWLDIDIITNPNPFPQLQTLQNKISDLEKTTSHFPSDLKKEMINDLKNFSNSLKCSFYAIFKQYIEQYITNTNLVLLFMINYPQLFSEDFDIESSPFIEIYSLFWHFLADIHVTSSTPELFPELCKNTATLSSEQTKSLVIVLIDKFISTIVQDILSDISDWDDDTKSDLIQKTREMYPKASNNLNQLLRGKNKRNILKQDFLNVSKNAMIRWLDEKYSQLFEGDFHQAINTLSFICMPIADEETIDNMFYTYVSLFLEQQFQKSHQNNTNKTQQKIPSTESVLISTLISSQKNNSGLLSLPEGLHDEISQYITNQKINGNSGRLIVIIEKILQKNLTKNESIRKQWFLDKISSYGLGSVDYDFFVLLESYGFSCIDAHKKVEKHSTEEKDALLGMSDASDNKISLPDSKNTILASLSTLDALQRLEWESKKDYLLKKMRWYVDIFEQLGYTFTTKEKFIESSTECCYSNLRLDKDIRRIIYDIVVKNKQEQHRDWRDYYTFDMANGWRILLSKKWIIDNIWPHDYYEKYLKNNF